MIRKQNLCLLLWLILGVADHSGSVLGQSNSDWQPSFVANSPIDLEPSQATTLPSVGGLNPNRDQAADAGFESKEPGNTIAGIAGNADNINSGAMEANANVDREVASYLIDQASDVVSREGTGSTIKIALLLGALSLAPAIILMSTCYVRLIVVLSLLKQAFGAQQLPPTQVITSLALFLTFLIMTPVWKEIKKEAIDPYANSQSVDWQQALERGMIPVKRFMTQQIQTTGGTESVAMMYRYLPDQSKELPQDLMDVPINVLLPAFMISELKVAFLLGFQIFLPFLVVDLVVSTVTVSMGMLMLPPTMVSLPLKLILFVMVDGWNLVVGMLLQSFGMWA